MADTAPPTVPAGDRLRLIIDGRRRARVRLLIAALGACAVLPLSLPLAWRPTPVLVWNASESAPVGLYRLHSGAPLRRGDMAVGWLPEPSRSLAARRRYIPLQVPVVKRVAAVPGDRVCALGPAVTIGAGRAALRRIRDRAGRPMIWWNGCRLLRPGEVFLLSASPDSFDGRYFGITRESDLLGRADLLWAG